MQVCALRNDVTATLYFFASNFPGFSFSVLFSFIFFLPFLLFVSKFSLILFYPPAASNNSHPFPERPLFGCLLFVRWFLFWLQEYPPPPPFLCRRPSPPGFLLFPLGYPLLRSVTSPFVPVSPCGRSVQRPPPNVCALSFTTLFRASIRSRVPASSGVPSDSYHWNSSDCLSTMPLAPKLENLPFFPFFSISFRFDEFRLEHIYTCGATPLFSMQSFGSVGFSTPIVRPRFSIFFAF